MLHILPLFIWTAMSAANFSGCFVNLMTATMDKSWDRNKKDEIALFAMIALGFGEMVGGLIYGQVADRWG